MTVEEAGSVRASKTGMSLGLGVPTLDRKGEDNGAEDNDAGHDK